jgi:hypothetical protein
MLGYAPARHPGWRLAARSAVATPSILGTPDCGTVHAGDVKEK